MNYLIDIVILLCIGWGAIKGFKKGFIIQSFTILSLVLAIWAALTFTSSVEPSIQAFLGISGNTSLFVSFIAVFVSMWLIVYTVGRIVSAVATAAALGMINRLAGASFGILSNAFILSVIFLVFGLVNANNQFVKSEDLEKSHLHEPIKRVAPAIFPDKFFRNLIS